jgi:hypothetical protein
MASLILRLSYWKVQYVSIKLGEFYSSCHQCKQELKETALAT